jgi:hypothetical protein
MGNSSSFPGLCSPSAEWTGNGSQTWANRFTPFPFTISVHKYFQSFLITKMKVRMSCHKQKVTEVQFHGNHTDNIKRILWQEVAVVWGRTLQTPCSSHSKREKTFHR